MSQFPDDAFMTTILAIISQRVFKDLLTPFLMAKYIVPCYFTGGVCLWNHQMKLFIGRLSRATHCFDRYLAIIYHIAEFHQNKHNIQRRVTRLCRHLDFSCTAVSEPKTIDRIKSAKYEYLWMRHSRATLILASVFRFNSAYVAERLFVASGNLMYEKKDGIPELSEYQLGYFALCIRLEWSVPPLITATPMGLVTVDSANLKDAEVHCGIILPPGILAQQLMLECEARRAES